MIDDEPLLLKSYKRLLPDNFEVVTAGNGRDALDCLSRDSFDAILCDIMMPDVSGDDIYNVMLKDKPEQARRFIFITGGTFTSKTNNFVHSTDRPCLAKPIDENDLIDIIQKVVANANA